MNIVLTESVQLSSLTNAEIRELQTALNQLGYQAGPNDGFVGPRTLDAWADFKESINQDDPKFLEWIGPSSLKELANELKKLQDGATQHNFATKEGTIAAIHRECDRQGLVLRSQHAYVLATVQHETANTFKPVEEYGKGKGRPYGRPDPITRQAYYGRGFVQLTWKSNYQKYSTILGIDLVNKPELACNPNVALFILVHGFKTGAFTGKRLTDYVNQNRCDFFNARRCINGLDKAEHIARLAESYLRF